MAGIRQNKVKCDRGLQNPSSLVYSLFVYAAIIPVSRPRSRGLYIRTIAESYCSLVCVANNKHLCQSEVSNPSNNL